MARNPLMAYKKKKLVETSCVSDGGDAAGDFGVDDDYGTKKYDEIFGFYDEGVLRTLYQIWRTAMKRAIGKFSVYGPGETGRDRFARFYEWGAAQPATAPLGQINYHDESCRSALNQLMFDGAEKVRKSR